MLLYTDVWGPLRVTSVDGFHFYVTFVDHVTKYCWFYPMKQKSILYAIFSTFKELVENFF